MDLLTAVTWYTRMDQACLVMCQSAMYKIQVSDEKQLLPVAPVDTSFLLPYANCLFNKLGSEPR